jgi:hypothetical protein
VLGWHGVFSFFNPIEFMFLIFSLFFSTVFLHFISNATDLGSSPDLGVQVLSDLIEQKKIDRAIIARLEQLRQDTDPYILTDKVMTDSEMIVELKPHAGKDVYKVSDFRALSCNNRLAWQLDKQYGSAKGFLIYKAILLGDYSHVWGHYVVGGGRTGGSPEFATTSLPYKITPNPEYTFYNALIDLTNQTKTNPFSTVCLALSYEQIQSLRGYLDSKVANGVLAKLDRVIEDERRLKAQSDSDSAAQAVEHKRLLEQQALNARRAELRAFFEHCPDNAKTYVFNSDDTLLGEYYVVRSEAHELFLISVDTYDFYLKLKANLSGGERIPFDSICVDKLFPCPKIERYDVPIEIDLINVHGNKPYYFLGSKDTLSNGLKQVSISGKDVYFSHRTRRPYFAAFGGSDLRAFRVSIDFVFVQPKVLKLPVIAPPVSAPKDTPSAPPVCGTPPSLSTSLLPSAPSDPVLPSANQSSSFISNKSSVLPLPSQSLLFVNDNPSIAVSPKHQAEEVGSHSDSLAVTSNQVPALAALATSLVFFVAAGLRYRQIKQHAANPVISERLENMRAAAKKWLAIYLVGAASAGLFAGGLCIKNK